MSNAPDVDVNDDDAPPDMDMNLDMNVAPATDANLIDPGNSRGVLHRACLV